MEKKVSTKSLMAALSDCFPSSSCLLLLEYWNLVPSNISVRVKETNIWLPFKTLGAHFLSKDAASLPHRELKLLMPVLYWENDFIILKLENAR